MSSLKLEVGKYYRTRDGHVVGPTKYLGDGHHYPFCIAHTYSSSCTFSPEGIQRLTKETAGDLIEEVREPTYDFKHTPDTVNRPAHYTQGSVECIEAIKASMSAEAFRGYLKGNAMKYLWRYENKGGVESLQKQQWYSERLIAELDEK